MPVKEGRGPLILQALVERPRAAFAFGVASGKIVGIDLIADPGRLGRLDLAVLDN